MMIDRKDFLVYVGLFVLSFLLGTVIEYIVHRFILHNTRVRLPYLLNLIPRKHNAHHKLNSPDSIWENYKTYIWIFAPFIWVGFCYDWVGGIIFIVGGLLFVLWLSTVHHSSHTANTKGNRLDKLMYYEHILHHKNNKVNYGVTTSVWDKIFGTYSEE